MTSRFSLFESPVFNWSGVAVSFCMLLLYVQQLGEVDRPASVPYVTAAWAVIFTAWLLRSVYLTFFAKRQ